MALIDEVKAARRKVVTDGYDMSIGEIASLYKDGELIINPNFQRLFRWDDSQKTRFIESILLGIPVPPIFVFQTEDAKWELVDGLQRLSTIFEFMGILKDEAGNALPASYLERTKQLTSLGKKAWESDEENGIEGIGPTLQLEIRRARLRVEILKNESDTSAKFELFQRLNTGGAELSEQEIRTCTAVMLNPDFYDWLRNLASDENFSKVLSITEYAEKKQKDVELVLRLLVFRLIPYSEGLDVHEYLDDGLIQLATTANYDRDQEKVVFLNTFALLASALGNDAFKRWDGQKFMGSFSLAAYEVIAFGISQNIDDYQQNANGPQAVVARIKNLWGNADFLKFSKAGVRGTTRLANLLPRAKDFMKP